MEPVGDDVLGNGPGTKKGSASVFGFQTLGRRDMGFRVGV